MKTRTRTNKRAARRLLTAVVVCAIACFDAVAASKMTAYILQNYNDAGFAPGSEGYASLVTMGTCAALLLPLLQMLIICGALWLAEGRRDKAFKRDAARIEDAIATLKTENQAEKDRQVEKEILENIFNAPGFDSLADYYADKDSKEWAASHSA